jgi:hypothetical protein
MVSSLTPAFFRSITCCGIRAKPESADSNVPRKTIAAIIVFFHNHHLFTRLEITENRAGN